MYEKGIGSAYRGGGCSRDPYLCEWGQVVGDRVRRLRRDRDLTLVELARMTPKPDGGSYSLGFLSRLERGFASGPLFAYLMVARALEVEGAVLLGPDAASLETSPEEALFLQFVRRLEIALDEAMLALSAAAARPAPAAWIPSRQRSGAALSVPPSVQRTVPPSSRSEAGSMPWPESSSSSPDA